MQNISPHCDKCRVEKNNQLKFKVTGLHAPSRLPYRLDSHELMTVRTHVCGYPSSSSVRVRARRSNASLIMRRLEEVSLQPVLPPPPPIEDVDPPGLPSYEQAIAKCGPHDAPPPPYPGYLCLHRQDLHFFVLSHVISHVNLCIYVSQTCIMLSQSVYLRLFLS